MTVKEAYELYSADKRLDIWAHLPKLREWAKGNVLEIGVQNGISTAAILLGLEEKEGHLWSVDVCPSCRYVWYKHPQWTFLCLDSTLCPQQIIKQIPGPLDLLFIDGWHSYETVSSDLRNFAPLVHPGGVIACHDVLHEKFFPGVRKAFDEWQDKPEYASEILEDSCGLGVLTVRG